MLSFNLFHIFNFYFLLLVLSCSLSYCIVMCRTAYVANIYIPPAVQTRAIVLAILELVDLIDF